MENSLPLLEDMRAEIKRRRPLRHLISIWHKLHGRNNLREVTRFGLKWNLTYHQLEKRIVRDGIHEPEQLEYFFTQAKARRCDIFLDVGANIGLYNMFAAKTRLFEEIHAWEPSPDNFERLQWHLRENNFADKVRTYQTAVSDSCGKVYLYREDWKNPGGTQVINSPESGVEVEAATLDSLFNFRGRKFAVKMDIEGHEISALRGAEKLFAENDIFLQVEVWNVETINYLLSQGFRMVYYVKDDFYFERQRIGGKI